MTATLSRVRRWARRRCLTLLPVGTTCCAIELDAALGPVFDPSHHGVEVVDDPAVADVLVVAGRLSQQMAAEIRGLLDQMPPPPGVIAFGSCAISGGAWGEAGQSVDLTSLVDVDLHIPGCSPSPHHLYDAIQRLRSL
ncbi:MAG: NADH-quinone oxidoreductase subunit NuoB [Gemmatimonadetes bacterium]|nr:NADH-quinone oxidoreductase subunit NuoB [Gemmatimonadota bacterium]MBT7859672.1 NADH-quinone oxidoreductase subunit NuoB [Gemmatimonadota bacterium]